MIKNLLLLLFVSLSLSAAAIQSDTTAYQTQRLKVNALLAERSQKFGQYDQSLSTRTGIFGLQTKKDVENSNEILRQIVLNDNNIFKELKILMDYKDQQVKSVQDEANAVNSRALNYKNAIKKLQDENQQLRTETGKKENFSYYVIAFLVLVLIGSTYFFLKKINKEKSIR